MILVAGEALIDMLPRSRGDEQWLLPVPGGSPFNVARALGRLGTATRFLCRISLDAFGERLSRSLVESRVSIKDCPRTAALSTLGFVSFDPATQSARYAFYTDGTAGCGLAREDVPGSLSEEITAVHVGSFALAVEPCGSSIEQLVLDRSGERFVSFDPNIRPFLISDRASYLARYSRIAGRADLLKMSLEDLEWLHPGMSPEEVTRDYLGKGMKAVVLTRGKEGATATNRVGSAAVAAAPVTVVDTVGAGDCFQAALLRWLEERNALAGERLANLPPDDLRSMLAFATRAAGVNCTRAGCEPAWRHEIPESGSSSPT